MLRPPHQPRANHRRQCQSCLDDHGVPVASAANRVSPRRDAQNRLHLHPEEAGEKSGPAAEQRPLSPSLQAGGQEASESSCPWELEAMEPLRSRGAQVLSLDIAEEGEVEELGARSTARAARGARVERRGGPVRVRPLL